MKKMIFLLAAVVLLMTLAVPAFAADTELTVSASSDLAYAGDVVELTVSVSGDTPYTSIGYEFSFDKQVFEFVGYEQADDVGAMFEAFDDAKNTFMYLFKEPTTYAGVLWKITLKVKEGAPAVTATIGGKVNAKNGSDTVAVTLKAAQVTIGCRHNYTWANTDAQTHTGTCVACGDVKTESHIWADEGINVTPATCTEVGSETFECLLCLTQNVVELPAKGHAWTNDCDTDCDNGCGEVREITHQYAQTLTSDAQQHWYPCEICGDKKDAAAHTPGAAATETNPQVCTDCGHVLQTALGHVHDFGTAWQEDSDAHWHICMKPGCYDRDNYGAHVYDNACDMSCNTCGHVRVAPHEYGMEWRGNKDGHWHVCLICSAKSDVLPHVPSASATPDGSMVCSDCQIKLDMQDHQHNYGTTWETTEQGHWKICLDCNASSEIAPHAWDDGVVLSEPTETQEGSIRYLCVECRIERTATLPAISTDPSNPSDPSQGVTTPTTPGSSGQPERSGGFPWWILVVLAAVMLVTGIVLFVIELIRSKKVNAHGKFSK